MKKILILTAISLIAVFIFLGCNKSSLNDSAATTSVKNLKTELPAVNQGTQNTKADALVPTAFVKLSDEVVSAIQNGSTWEAQKVGPGQYVGYITPALPPSRQCLNEMARFQSFMTANRASLQNQANMNCQPIAIALEDGTCPLNALIIPDSPNCHGPYHYLTCPLIIVH